MHIDYAKLYALMRARVFVHQVGAIGLIHNPTIIYLLDSKLLFSNIF